MVKKGASAKGALRREQILEAAYRVVAEHGYNGSTLRAIAREVEMEPAHVLYYFGSREALLREVVERWDEHNWRMIAENADGSREDFLELFPKAIRRNLEVRGIVHLYISFAAEAVDPDHAAHAYFAERFASIQQGLAMALEKRKRAGLVAADLDVERAARGLIALSDGLQLQALVDPSVDAPSGVEAAVQDLGLTGLARGPEQPSS